MRTNDKNLLNTILLHKDHFNHKLIEIAQNLETQVSALTTANEKLKYVNLSLRDKNKCLLLKVKDTESLKSTLNIKYMELKNERDEFLEELKKIQKEIDKLKRENEKQRKEIDKHKKEIKDYNSIVDKLKHTNSSNSNMPSSTDILSHTRVKAQANKRVATDRKRGGQVNHPLHKSVMRKKADQVNELKVKKAPMGAIPFKNNEEQILYYVTQEVDLLLKSVITETRYYIDPAAEELDQDTLRRYAVNPLTYSANFKAVSVYLNQKGCIPLQRLCDMMLEISKGSIQIQPSTISKWCVECHKKSKAEKEKIIKEVLEGAVIHVDETGIKINGEQYWVHVMTNEKGSIFLVSKQRGDKEKGPIYFLDTYTGTLVHDHFKPYLKLKLCQHAECNAHIDRYLKAGIEFDHSKECQEILDLLHEMLHHKNELLDQNKEAMAVSEIENYEKKYTEILERGLAKYQEKHPKMKKKYEPEYIKTFRRMLVYKQDHLRFIHDFMVPYSNNEAERKCRVVKSKKNASGQFVTELGGEAYVSILSLLQTARTKKENALETLTRVFQ